MWRVIPAESSAQADQVAAKIVEQKIRRGYREGIEKINTG
jgi:predicted DNA-binding WGR domain protein